MCTPEINIIDDLVGVVANCLQQGLRVIVVHGAGSFGHLRAKHWRLNEGLIANHEFSPQEDCESQIQAVKVEEGIYFVNGYFVRNASQLLIIDKYYDKPSAKVGFTIKEEIVTPEEESTLYDNSIGSANYTAPGAL